MFNIYARKYIDARARALNFANFPDCRFGAIVLSSRQTVADWTGLLHVPAIIYIYIYIIYSRTHVCNILHINLYTVTGRAEVSARHGVENHDLSVKYPLLRTRTHTRVYIARTCGTQHRPRLAPEFRD